MASCSAAFPDGMPWSAAAFDNSVTRTIVPDPVNIAFGQPVTMSSSYLDRYNPAYGVDGGRVQHTSHRNQAVIGEGATCIETAHGIGSADAPSWFQVDLGSMHLLDEVVMHSRPGNWRLRGAVVVVSNTADYTTGTVIGSLTSELVQTLPCGIAGSFVTVMHHDVIAFCEIEVMMTPFSASNTTTCNAGYNPIAATTEECALAKATLGLHGDATLPCADSDGFPVCIIPLPDDCVRRVTQSFAEEVCEAEGARLCTEAEVEADCGCDSTTGMVWTATPCVPEAMMAMCSDFLWVPPTSKCYQEDEFESLGAQGGQGHLGGRWGELNDWKWLDRPCAALQVQVDVAGQVNVVHSGDIRDVRMNFEPLYRQDSRNTFPVRWTDGLSPDPAANCSSSADCMLRSTSSGDSCVCTTTTVDSAVFTNANTMPSTEQVLDRLRIGATAPVTFDAGVYERCETAACAAAAAGGVEVWNKNGSPVNGSSSSAVLDVDTIFGISWKTRQVLCHPELRFSIPAHANHPG